MRAHKAGISRRDGKMKATAERPGGGPAAGKEKGGRALIAQRKRYHMLDLIRGLALCSMMLYHAAWDLVWLFGVDWPWYSGRGAFVWQQATCWTFILLSGFCAPMSRSGGRRGLLVFGCGWAITLCMELFSPATPNYFGILVLLGSAMLLTWAMRQPLRKLPAGPAALLSFGLFLATRWVSRGRIGWGRLSAALPPAFYANDFTAFLGFPPRGFYSTDYFPLVPWFFLFLTGYFLHFLARRQGWLERLPDLRAPVLNWLGRRSLPVYMLHQPVILALLWIGFRLF